MELNFKVGDPVWARMKSYPPWPARIAEPDVPKKGQVYVYFFGSKPSYGWVPSNAVTAFDSHKEDLVNVSKKPDFKVALKQIEEYRETKDLGGSNDKDEVEGESDKGDGDENTSADSEPQRRKRQPKRKFSIESGDSSTPASKGKGKRKISDMFENGPKKSKISILNPLRDAKTPSPDVFDRPEIPAMDLGNISELLKSKSIEPSTYKFGFLGLGIMGTGIVNNLINSGHKVNLWSRNPDKVCQKLRTCLLIRNREPEQLFCLVLRHCILEIMPFVNFTHDVPDIVGISIYLAVFIRQCTTIKEQADKIQEGLVEIFLAPCEVMENSDIVFSCSSDPESAKNNVFENCGVIQQVGDTLDGKGFVEMTGIDPQTSQKIAEVIRSKGGRYLEAQLQGSREEANEGSLVILTAGDKDLFMDCQSCFKAMGKTSLYLGDVGVATKVYLILQLMQGIALVGLAEGLVLADRCGISGKDIVNIFNMTSLSSPYLRNKANIIVNKDFKKVEQSIKNMQKDIRLALGLSDELMQPLMMASAANEVYKHSRKLGYDEHDCACIYMKARY